MTADAFDQVHVAEIRRLLFSSRVRRLTGPPCGCLRAREHEPGCLVGRRIQPKGCGAPCRALLMPRPTEPEVLLRPSEDCPCSMVAASWWPDLPEVS